MNQPMTRTDERGSKADRSDVSTGHLNDVHNIYPVKLKDFKGKKLERFV